MLFRVVVRETLRDHQRKGNIRRNKTHSIAIIYRKRFQRLDDYWMQPTQNESRASDFKNFLRLWIKTGLKKQLRKTLELVD